MESLKRKPNLSSKGSFQLDENTKIDIIRMTVRKANQIADNKKLSEFEKGIHGMAAKIHVNGQPIVPDDLLDCFSDDEFVQISKFIQEVEGIEEETGKNG